MQELTSDQLQELQRFNETMTGAQERYLKSKIPAWAGNLDLRDADIDKFSKREASRLIGYLEDCNRDDKEWGDKEKLLKVAKGGE